MRVERKNFEVRGLNYTVRSATEQDAEQLSALRLQIDGETENLNREPGEHFIDPDGFRHLIRRDTEATHNLFLVVETGGKLVGFSRCTGTGLKRMAHQVEFGICIMQAYWGYRIGSNLLAASIEWADQNNFRKVTLAVLETNRAAIQLYKKYGFEVEGVLKQDKLLSDGRYYDTLLMARFKDVGRRHTVRLAGGRIYIRKLNEADAHELLDWRIRNRAFLQPYEPIMPDTHFTLEGQLKVIQRAEEGWTNDLGYSFGIFDQTSEQLIGRVNLSNVSRGAWENCTIGYSLDEAQNGKGYATEAVRLAVKFALETAELHRVQAAVMPRNERSIRVLERVGFRYEGFAEHYLKINGVWEHHHIYSVTREHWDRQGTE